MRRKTWRGRANDRAGGRRLRGRAPAGDNGPPPRPEAQGSPERLDAAEFLTRLKRAQLPQPDAAQLVSGQVTTVPPLAGPGAVAIQRLERHLVSAAAGAGGAVIRRPLVRLGTADLWRPHLGLLGTTAATALEGPAGSTSPGALLLLVLLGEERHLAGYVAGYAAAGAQELWALDLCAGWTVRYRSPWSGKFHSRTLWYPGEAVPLTNVPGAQVVAIEEGFKPLNGAPGGRGCGS